MRCLFLIFAAAAFLDEVDHLFAGCVQLVAGALHFPHGRGSGLDLRLEVEIGIDIAALHGGGADLVRLEVLPQDGHGQRGLDVGIKKIDIDGGIVRLGVGVDAEMAVFAEAGDGDLPFILVIEGIVKLDAEALGGGIDERDEQVRGVDDTLAAPVAVNKKMTADIVFHGMPPMSK